MRARFRHGNGAGAPGLDVGGRDSDTATGQARALACQARERLPVLVETETPLPTAKENTLVGVFEVAVDNPLRSHVPTLLSTFVLIWLQQVLRTCFVTLTRVSAAGAGGRAGAGAGGRAGGRARSGIVFLDGHRDYVLGRKIACVLDNPGRLEDGLSEDGDRRLRVAALNAHAQHFLQFTCEACVRCVDEARGRRTGADKTSPFCVDQQAPSEPPCASCLIEPRMLA